MPRVGEFDVGTRPRDLTVSWVASVCPETNPDPVPTLNSVHEMMGNFMATLPLRPYNTSAQSSVASFTHEKAKGVIEVPTKFVA